MNNSKLVYCLLMVSLAPSILFIGLFNSLGNTLYNNGEWVSAKTQLKKGVIGANDFYFSRNPLRGGHLDLSSWHGYQEIIYKKPIVPIEIDFDFLLTDNSYIVFEFNKNMNKFAGIRVSLAEKFNNIYFVSSDEGEFIYKEELGISPLRPNKWNHIKIHFDNDVILLYLNKQFIKTIEIPLLIPQKVGFRGGANKALIDNVVIHERYPSSVIRENFDNNNFYQFFCIFGVIVLLNFLISNFLKKLLKKTLKQRLFILISGNIVLTILLSLLLSFDYFYASKRYFHAKRTKMLVNTEKQYWIHSDPESILRQIKYRYTDSRFKETIRILFIGTSQTWGAGARDETETFVKQIEKKMNSNTALKRHFTCINAGISGLFASRLFEYYKSEWIRLEPQMVVIILSINDTDSVEFSNFLRRFADLNRSKGIKTVFVLEASSIEIKPGGCKLHKFMRQIGREEGVPVLDLHSYLLLNYDKGFLWWDSGHLTSFGQKMAADFLFEKLLALFILNR